MKLSFDRAATRKLELWATSRGQDIDDLEAISSLVMEVVEEQLDRLRAPVVVLAPTPGEARNVS